MLLGGLCVLELELKEAIPPEPSGRLALLSLIYSDCKQTWSFLLGWSLRTTVKRLFLDFSSQMWGLG